MKKRLSLFVLASTSLLLAACGQDDTASDQTQSSAKEKSAGSVTSSSGQVSETAGTETYYIAEINGVTKVDALTHEVIDTIEVNGVVYQVQISPDEKVLAITTVPLGDPVGQFEENNLTGEMGSGMAAFYDADTGELITEVEVDTRFPI